MVVEAGMRKENKKGKEKEKGKEKIAKEKEKKAKEKEEKAKVKEKGAKEKETRLASHWGIKRMCCTCPFILSGRVTLDTKYQVQAKCFYLGGGGILLVGEEWVALLLVMHGAIVDARWSVLQAMRSTSTIIDARNDGGSRFCLKRFLND